MTADPERAIAANRGERSEAPDWICAHIVG